MVAGEEVGDIFRAGKAGESYESLRRFVTTGTRPDFQDGIADMRKRCRLEGAVLPTGLVPGKPAFAGSRPVIESLVQAAGWVLNREVTTLLYTP